MCKPVKMQMSLSRVITSDRPAGSSTLINPMGKRMSRRERTKPKIKTCFHAKNKRGSSQKIHQRQKERKSQASLIIVAVVIIVCLISSLRVKQCLPTSSLEFTPPAYQPEYCHTDSPDTRAGSSQCQACPYAQPR